MNDVDNIVMLQRSREGACGYQAHEDGERMDALIGQPLTAGGDA